MSFTSDRTTAISESALVPLAAAADKFQLHLFLFTDVLACAFSCSRDTVNNHPVLKPNRNLKSQQIPLPRKDTRIKNLCDVGCWLGQRVDPRTLNKLKPPTLTKTSPPQWEEDCIVGSQIYQNSDATSAWTATIGSAVMCGLTPDTTFQTATY